MRRICPPATADAPTTDGAPVRRMRIARGAALYRAGDPVRSLYVLRSGCIKEFEWTLPRREAIMGFALPGEILIMHLAGARRCRTNGTALETSHVCAIPWRLATRCNAAVRSPAADLNLRLNDALTAARELVTLVRDKDALQRVAGFLLNIAGRLEARGGAVRCAEDQSRRGAEFRLGMCREDIANYLGLRGETVSRCVSELEARRLLAARGRRINLLQPAALRRLYAGGERDDE